ncbi:RDD family protein [Actinomyces sp. B33]|uniref:FHA domain-containing protein n=1 Tax=Actinomyces sp. B33 TaxID=2942131 RepID=UPI0023410A0C|nr:RDD family protein [Actinomyces sp. B33]MDC4233623.1 RDD family protein [Actinomyces sp. B33]
MPNAPRSLPRRSDQRHRRSPAPVRARAVAVLIDAAIIAVLVAAVWLPWLFESVNAPVSASSAVCVALVILLGLRLLILMLASATPGMMIAGIRMIDCATAAAPAGRALAHSLLTGGFVLVTAGIGSVLLLRSASRDAEGAGWHDHLTGVRLVEDASAAPAADRPSPASFEQRYSLAEEEAPPQILIDSVPWSNVPVPVDAPAGHTVNALSVLPADVVEQALSTGAGPKEAAPARAASDGAAQPARTVPEPERSAEQPAPPRSSEDVPTAPDAAMPPTDPPGPEPAAARGPETAKGHAVLPSTVAGPEPSARVRLIPLDEGPSFDVTGITVVGRKPENISDAPDAALLVIGDLDYSLSKTHALLIPTENGLWVMDLHSTNGTRVTVDGRTKVVTDLEPAPRGSIVTMGRRAFRVDL